jgi:hypothetical protein
MDVTSKVAEILASDYPHAALEGYLSAVVDIAVITLDSALNIIDGNVPCHEPATELIALPALHAMLTDLQDAKHVKKFVTQAIDDELNAKYGLGTPAHSKTV